jgi:hypothetical protein
MDWQRAVVAPGVVWAQATFGRCRFGDWRLTERVVGMAAAMAACPGGSLPQQLPAWEDLKGAYRFLEHPAVTVAGLLRPHQEQTRQVVAAQPVGLLVQDTTVLDFSRHRKTTGLGPIGNGGGRGIHLQTMLAVEPVDGVPLGVLAAETWVRRAPVASETRAERRTRPRESQRWGRLVRQVGSPPPDVLWVHVADREADCFDFLAAVVAVGAEVLVRIAQNRRVQTVDGRLDRLFTQLTAQPAQAQQVVALPPRARAGERVAHLSISWTSVQVLPPQPPPPELVGHPPIAAWAIRVWEADPPSNHEPIAWNLLTTLPVATAEAAWERVRWYTHRWVIEDFHQALKTGCAVEASQLRDGAKLQRQIAMLVPLAVRLLQLRSLARVRPDTPATELLPATVLAVLARQTRTEVATTAGDLWPQVARLGGWLARRGDGPPGWRTLWRGWFRLLAWQEGIALSQPESESETYG